MSTVSSNLSITSSGRRSSRATTLTPDETDLWELCHYAGVTIDPQVFHNLMDLLHMDIHPQAVLEMLTKISQSSKYKDAGGDSKQTDAKKKDPKMLSQTRKPSRSFDNKSDSNRSTKQPPNVSTRRKEPLMDTSKSSTTKSKTQTKPDSVKSVPRTNK